jgi:hypothetical protein
MKGMKDNEQNAVHASLAVHIHDFARMPCLNGSKIVQGVLQQVIQEALPQA